LKTPQGSSAGIDHLVEMGINAVELMPVMEYDFKIRATCRIG
jgi:1,4-alpha-glucan branching enzyme